jgi:hypothetical protein
LLTPVKPFDIVKMAFDKVLVSGEK